MTRVAAPTRAELSAHEETFTFIEKVTGFVPASLYAMGLVPPILDAFAVLSTSVLTPREVDQDLKWLVAHISSRAAGCRYCWAHTATNAEAMGADVAKIEAAWEFESSPLFNDAERAALRVAAAGGVSPNGTTDAQFDELKLYFSDAAICEIVAVIALFGFLNRWNDTMATTLEASPLAFGREHLGASGWDPGRHLEPRV